MGLGSSAPAGQAAPPRAVVRPTVGLLTKAAGRLDGFDGTGVADRISPSPSVGSLPTSMSASKPAQPASAPEPLTGLKQLRTELGQVNDRLADARAREAAAALARSREEVALLGITEQEVRRALGYDRPARLPAKYYDPVTGSKWSGKGKRPRWLVDKRLEDYAIDAPQPKTWWPGEK